MRPKRLIETYNAFDSVNSSEHSWERKGQNIHNNGEELIACVDYICKFAGFCKAVLLLENRNLPR